MRGQWYIVAAVLFSFSLLTLFNIFNSYSRIDYTSVLKNDEDLIFPNLVEELNNTVENSENIKNLNADVGDLLEMAENSLIGKGYFFRYNLSTSNGFNLSNLELAGKNLKINYKYYRSPECDDGICDPGECSAGCTLDCSIADCCGIEDCNPAIGENCSNCETDCGPCGCVPDGDSGICPPLCTEDDDPDCCQDSGYIWDVDRCCGDDGAADNWCNSGDGSCVEGAWFDDHCNDNIQNCDEVGVDCGGSDCPSCSPMPGWSFRRAINISNTGGDLTDYQVKITVDYDSDMQLDYDDLRFADTNSNNLSYWIENYTTSNATVWVKVPFLESNTNTTIYMYYGNSSVSSASNGTETFEFFDDFSVSSFSCYENDLTGGCTWACTTTDSLNTCTTQSSDYHTSPYATYVYSGGTGYCGDGGLFKEITMPVGDSRIEFWAKNWGGNWGGRAGVTIDTGYWGPRECEASDSYDMVHWLVCGRRDGTHSCGTTTDLDTGEEYTPTQLGTSWQFYSEDSSQWAEQTIKIRLELADYSCHWCNMGDHDKKLWVDDIRIRKYASPEPTYTIGGEETLS